MENTNIPTMLSLPEKWVVTKGNTKPLDNGAYVVTIIDGLDHRKVELAMYLNGTWVLNNADRHTNCRVIAYMKDIQSTFVPFEGTIQEFSKGDIIVWHNDADKNKTVMCWMLIGSFDYPSDRAARAVVGKEYFSQDVQTTYGNWVPNNFGKDVRLATETEINIVTEEMLNYYKTQFVARYANVGKEIMRIDLEEIRLDLYNKLLNMWDENE